MKKISEFIKKSWRGEEEFWKVFFVWGGLGIIPYILAIIGFYVLIDIKKIYALSGWLSLFSIIMVWKNLPSKNYIKLFCTIFLSIALYTPSVMGIMFILGSLYGVINVFI